jgi:hypothetical protein
MNTLANIRRMATVIVAACAMAAPAFAQDAPVDGHLHLTGGSVAFLAGVSWGHGRLEFNSHSYRVKVRGLKVGSIGVASYSASGDVFHLRHARDIDGTYGTATASGTAGVGAGVIRMQNGKGVVINMTMDTAGLQATLAPGGLEIELE